MSISRTEASTDQSVQKCVRGSILAVSQVEPSNLLADAPLGRAEGPSVNSNDVQMQIRSFGHFPDAIVIDQALEVPSSDIDIKGLTNVDWGSSLCGRNAPTENQSLIRAKSLEQPRMNVEVLVDGPGPSPATQQVEFRSAFHPVLEQRLVD
jgi:hypothetical protein